MRVGMVVALLTSVSSVSAQIRNGNFEARPNRAWMTDGILVPRVANGDKPVIRPVAPNR